MPSDLNGFIFAVALVIFGAGFQYLMPEHRTLGVILILVGVAGMLYSARSLFLPGLIRQGRKAEVSHPFGAPLVGALVVVVVVMLFFWGGWWFLKPGVKDPGSQVAADLPKGSLRFGREEIHPLVVREEFKVNWDVVNPGPGRTFNAWAFYKGYVEEADKGADEKVRALFENDLRQYRKNPPQGQEIGPGEDMFFTIRTPPITQQQYEGILKGTIILYFAAWVRWTDMRGVEEPPLSRCMRLHTEGLPPSDIPQKAAWVFCMSAKRSPS